MLHCFAVSTKTASQTSIRDFFTMRRSGGPKSKSAFRSGTVGKSLRRVARTPKSTKPAEGLKGIRVGVSKAPISHRFTRWAPTFLLETQSAGGGVYTVSATNQDGGGTTVPFTLSAATADVVNGAQFGAGVDWTLGDLPAKSDFTSLFDHYSIEQVDVEIDCLQNSAASGASGATVTSAMPSITYVPDFDDSAAPASANEINEYQRAKVWTFRGSGKPLKFSIKPRTALTVYQGITSAYAAGPENVSLNLAYPDVPHYGLKFWVNNMEATGTNGADTLRVKMRYHLRFTDPK